MSDVGAEVPKLANLVGLVITVGSIFLQTVPKPVIDLFNISYDEYEIFTFGAIVMALIYCLTLGSMFYKINNVRKLSREVLEYSSARMKARSSNKSIQPNANASAN